MDYGPINWYPEPVPIGFSTPTIYVPPSSAQFYPPPPPPHFPVPHQSFSTHPPPLPAAVVQDILSQLVAMQQTIADYGTACRTALSKSQERLSQLRNFTSPAVDVHSAAPPYTPPYTSDSPTITHPSSPQPTNSHPIQPISLNRKQLRGFRHRVALAAKSRVVQKTRKPDLLCGAVKYSRSKMNRGHRLWTVKANHDGVFPQFVEEICQLFLGPETSTSTSPQPATNSSPSPLTSDFPDHKEVLFSIVVSAEASLASPMSNRDVTDDTSTDIALASVHELDGELVNLNVVPQILEHGLSQISIESGQVHDWTISTVHSGYFSFTTWTTFSSGATANGLALLSQPCQLGNFLEASTGKEIDLDELWNDSGGLTTTPITLKNLFKPALVNRDCAIMLHEDQMLVFHEHSAIVPGSPQLWLVAGNFSQVRVLNSILKANSVAQNIVASFETLLVSMLGFSTHAGKHMIIDFANVIIRCIRLRFSTSSHTIYIVVCTTNVLESLRIYGQTLIAKMHAKELQTTYSAMHYFAFMLSIPYVVTEIILLSISHAWDFPIIQLGPTSGHIEVLGFAMELLEFNSYYFIGSKRAVSTTLAAFTKSSTILNYVLKALEHHAWFVDAMMHIFDSDSYIGAYIGLRGLVPCCGLKFKSDLFNEVLQLNMHSLIKCIDPDHQYFKYAFSSSNFSESYVTSNLLASVSSVFSKLLNSVGFDVKTYCTCLTYPWVNLHFMARSSKLLKRGIILEVVATTAEGPQVPVPAILFINVTNCMSTLICLLSPLQGPFCLRVEHTCASQFHHLGLLGASGFFIVFGRAYILLHESPCRPPACKQTVSLRHFSDAALSCTLCYAPIGKVMDKLQPHGILFITIALGIISGNINDDTKAILLLRSFSIYEVIDSLHISIEFSSPSMGKSTSLLQLPFSTLVAQCFLLQNILDNLQLCYFTSFGTIASRVALSFGGHLPVTNSDSHMAHYQLRSIHTKVISLQSHTTYTWTYYYVSPYYHLMFVLSNSKEHMVSKLLHEYIDMLAKRSVSKEGGLHSNVSMVNIIVAGLRGTSFDIIRPHVNIDKVTSFSIWVIALYRKVVFLLLLAISSKAHNFNTAVIQVVAISVSLRVKAYSVGGCCKAFAHSWLSILAVVPYCNLNDVAQMLCSLLVNTGGTIILLVDFPLLLTSSFGSLTLSLGAEWDRTSFYCLPWSCTVLATRLMIIGRTPNFETDSGKNPVFLDRAQDLLLHCEFATPPVNTKTAKHDGESGTTPLDADLLFWPAQCVTPTTAIQLLKLVHQILQDASVYLQQIMCLHLSMGQPFQVQSKGVEWVSTEVFCWSHFPITLKA